MFADCGTNDFREQCTCRSSGGIGLQGGAFECMEHRQHTSVGSTAPAAPAPQRPQHHDHSASRTHLWHPQRPQRQQHGYHVDTRRCPHVAQRGHEKAEQLEQQDGACGGGAGQAGAGQRASRTHQPAVIHAGRQPYLAKQPVPRFHAHSDCGRGKINMDEARLTRRRQDDKTGPA